MIVKIGSFNQLEIVEIRDIGALLDGGPYRNILLPHPLMTRQLTVGEVIEVFIYTDTEDRIIATMEKPTATVGNFAFLPVTAVNPTGAFLTWVQSKDLLVPYSQQHRPMEEGRSYWVYVYLDTLTERVVATSKLGKYLNTTSKEWTVNQEVELMIHSKTPIGYRVIVDKTQWGMLYDSEVFQAIEIGSIMPGYIKNIREDEKLDVQLQPVGYRAAIPQSAHLILDKLEENNGFLPINDKSSPEKIYDWLQISKKNFKKAVGLLYKRRMIKLTEKGIEKT